MCQLRQQEQCRPTTRLGYEEDTEPEPSLQQQVARASASSAVKRKHYRMAMKATGKALAEYGTTRDMVNAVCDALDAHKELYEDTGLLHRDVSPGNILIMHGGCGTLVDWLYSKDSTHPSRVPMKGGLACEPFSSYRLQRDTGKQPYLYDDLESFLWVTLYMIVCYRPLPFSSAALQSVIQSTFHSPSPAGMANERCRNQRGVGKIQFLRGEWIDNAVARFSAYDGIVPTPVTALLQRLTEIFSPLYPKPSNIDYGNERERSWMAQNLIVRLPAGFTRGMGRKQAAVAKAAYIAQHKAAGTLEFVQPPTIPPPPEIDYSQVSTHTTVLQYFTYATIQDDLLWDIGDCADKALNPPALTRSIKSRRPPVPVLHSVM